MWEEANHAYVVSDCQANCDLWFDGWVGRHPVTVDGVAAAPVTERRVRSGRRTLERRVPHRQRRVGRGQTLGEDHA